MRIGSLLLSAHLSSATHQGIPHAPAPEEDTIIIPGDSNYDYDTSNQEAGPMDYDMAQNYNDLFMDMQMCMVDVVYKYDLSQAVKETVDIVNDSAWIIELRAADAERSIEILAETLNPIARDLLGQTGQDLVDLMPPEILDWFVDSAVVFAVQQGTISQEQGHSMLELCPVCEEPETIEVEKIVYVEVPVEKIVEKIIYVDKEVPVEVEKIVYVDKPYEVEKIVYVDKPYEVQVEVEKIVYVEKNCPEPVEEPVEEPSDDEEPIDVEEPEEQPQEETVEEEETDTRKSKKDRNKSNVDTYTYTLTSASSGYYDYASYTYYYYADYNYDDYFNYYDSLHTYYYDVYDYDYTYDLSYYDQWAFPDEYYDSDSYVDYVYFNYYAEPEYVEADYDYTYTYDSYYYYYYMSTDDAAYHDYSSYSPAEKKGLFDTLASWFGGGKK